LKDSGAREEFPTGSMRDTRAGKGRFDLIPSSCLRRLARLYEKGHTKYPPGPDGVANWKKGQPLSRLLDSLLRHAMSIAEGQEDEDHAMQVAWNAFAIAWTLDEIRAGRLPLALLDLPYPQPYPISPANSAAQGDV
jgi:hypothetical protein